MYPVSYVLAVGSLTGGIYVFGRFADMKNKKRALIACAAAFVAVAVPGTVIGIDGRLHMPHAISQPRP